jgi:hypothetical protein
MHRYFRNRMSSCWVRGLFREGSSFDRAIASTGETAVLSNRGSFSEARQQVSRARVISDILGAAVASACTERSSSTP